MVQVVTVILVRARRMVQVVTVILIRARRIHWRRGSWVVNVSVSGSVGDRFKSRWCHLVDAYIL